MAARSRAMRVYCDEKAKVASQRLSLSIPSICRRYEVTRGFARYWRRKRVDPTFHIGTLGGARHCLMPVAVDEAVQVVLWQELRSDPLRNRWQLTNELVINMLSAPYLLQPCHAVTFPVCSEQKGQGIPVTYDWVRQTMTKWGYTRKVPSTA